MKCNKLIRAEEEAAKIDATLTAKEFSDKSVKIFHGDGSEFYFKYAFIKKATIDGDIFVCVFTEHHGNWVWHNEDLDKWECYDGIMLVESYVR
jgi:hypothetical protein